MRRVVAASALAVMMLCGARLAVAVDASGAWSICMTSGGIGCFPFTGSMVVANGHFTLSSFFFNFSGTVDSTTGAMVAPGGFTGTATDNVITGSIDFSPCFGYSLVGERACPACDDGDPCTVDGCGATICSGASTCTYGGVQDGTACDDGNACTHGDACRFSTSVNSHCTHLSTTTCDDGDPCTDDSCDPVTGNCVFTPNTDPCDDGNACTTNDHCSAGACVGTGCGPCESCGPVFGCMAVPLASCRPSGDGTIVMRDSDQATRDQLAWKWFHGAATSSTDLGDPAASDDYTLCVFDHPGPSPRLVLEATAPAGGDCHSDLSCWLAKGRPPGTSGFAYKARGELAPDGVQRVVLKPGAAGKARATVKARGGHLALPSLSSIAPPLTVQLRGQNGACFGTTFASASTERADLFRAQLASPNGAFVE